MTDAECKLYEQIMQFEREWLLAHPQPRKPIELPTIHYSELPEATPGPLATEWNFYRREVGRLLAEGHEEQWVLIKGEEIIGFWDNEEEVHAAAVNRYFMQPVLIHRILVREPILRGGGHNRRWH